MFLNLCQFLYSIFIEFVHLEDKRNQQETMTNVLNYCGPSCDEVTLNFSQ